MKRLRAWWVVLALGFVLASPISVRAVPWWIVFFLTELEITSTRKANGDTETKYRLDPWETLAMPPGEEGLVAFRLPDLRLCQGGANHDNVCSLDSDCPSGTCTGLTLLQSIDSVTMVTTGTDTPIVGYGPWTASAATTAAAESLSPAGPGRKWHGFRMSSTSNVAAGQLADFVVVTTYPKNLSSCNQIVSVMQADPTKAVLTAEGDGAGNPVSHFYVGLSGFQVDCIPAVSTWGLVVLTLLVVSAGSVVVRRRVALRTT